MDYLLRADVLAYMRQRWFGLTADGFHDVAAGLFREGQFELAVDTLRDMRVEGIHIQPWLYDMAVYLLAQKGEIDEALNLMKERVAAGELNISKNVWYCLLDVASQKFHVSVETQSVIMLPTTDHSPARSDIIRMEPSSHPGVHQSGFWPLFERPHDGRPSR